MLDTLKLRLEKIPLSDTSYFSPLFLDYLDQNPKLDSLVGHYPTLESFEDSIETRKFSMETRSSLVNVLTEQYKGMPQSENLVHNLNSLKQANGFTVTTGHQLNIFTGPLYFIYKIVGTIKCCQMLKEHYPKYDFVPVYWMASEDHDFAEINHINLFGKEYSWSTNQKGAVGRFNTSGLSEILDEIGECPQIFNEAYLQCKNLADATRAVVNHLFGEYGLVVLDPDHSELKKIFAPVIKDELLNQKIFHEVRDCSQKLQQKGYKTLVKPRKINLFYVENGLRERIVKKEDHYEVLATQLTFDQDEILAQVDSNPERFSPNVVMRTLYQESILPNLAYIGGPGELSYWMQFKTCFDHYQLPFPLLIPRNNVLLLNKGQTKKFDKLALKPAELFLDIQELKARFVERNTSATLDLEAEKLRTSQIFQDIIGKIKAIDGSLTGYIRAEENKALKNLDQIEKRLIKAEEQNQEVVLNQLLGLKDKLFPNGSLQERHDNFLNFYINNPLFIEELMEHLDPFDFNFHVLFENG